jgi:hypothetical protein
MADVTFVETLVRDLYSQAAFLDVCTNVILHIYSGDVIKLHSCILKTFRTIAYDMGQFVVSE